MLNTQKPTIPFWKVSDAVPNTPWITQDPEIWNAVTIAGFIWEGDAWVTGANKNRLDKKYIAGVNEATLTSLALDCKGFGVTLTIAGVNDWANLEKLMPALLRGGPIELYHPLLALFGIRAGVMKEIAFPRRSNGMNDILEEQILFDKYSPPARRSKGKVETASGPVPWFIANPGVVVTSVPYHLALPSSTETGPNLLDFPAPGFGG